MAVQQLNDVMDAAQDYKDKTFKGTVVDNKDPLHLNRVKATVPGLFEEGALPWIGCVKDSPFGHGPGFGVYGSPAVGSVIQIELQEGSAQHPISYGYFADTTTVDSEFTGPDVWGYKDPKGNKLRVDMAQGDYAFTHQSGSKVTFDSSGNLLMEGSGTATVKFPNIVLDGNVLIKGELTVEDIAMFLAGFVSNSGTGGSAGTMIGNVDHSNGNFTSNGIVIHLHFHNGVHGPTSEPVGNK